MTTRLSHRDLDTLQRTLRELYELRELEALRQALPAIALKLIPADCFTLVEVGFDARSGSASTLGIYGQPQLNRDSIARMERTVPAHPFTRQIVEQGPESAMMFSDFFSRPQLLRSNLYNEFYRHIGIGRSLSAAVFDSGRVYSLNVLRDVRAREFTERDRSMLELLRPHFEQARRNAVLYEGRQTRRARPLAVYDLTPRETDVAGWLAKGKTNGEIATILGASPRTVEKHVEKVLEKLGVENRTAAAVMISDSLGI
jgi:DNA-binding CsgD family transcriptional regulator